MINDKLDVKGRLAITLVGENGDVKLQTEVDNLVVQVGKNYLAGAILANATSPFTYMAIGTNGTAVGLADTTLGAEIARVAFTSSSVVNSVVTITTTFGAGVGTGALQEAGIFSAATLGTMLSHVTFGVINKAATDTLSITWTITL